MSARIIDPDVQLLASLSQSLREEYETGEVDPWADSPFGWIKTRPSRQVGAIGEKLVAGWCATKGWDVVRSPDSDADRIIEGHRVEIKFSTLWKSGGFKFQQVRNQKYDHMFCIGVSPFDAQAWIVPKSALYDHVIGVTGQHGGGGASETAWIGFDVDSPPSWIRPYGGNLAEAASVFGALGRGRY